MLTLKLLYHLPKSCSPETKMVEVLISPGVPRNFDSCDFSWEKLGEIVREWSKYENIKFSVCFQIGGKA